MWRIGQTTVYWGRGKSKRRYGFLLSTSTGLFRHDTWVAHDIHWKRIGCATTRAEAISMVLRNANVWRCSEAPPI